jgi:pyruvate/2-oxoglutarate dehydrogenase complex dihydrolipoamide acyltransferase (E2) component
VVDAKHRGRPATRAEAEAVDMDRQAADLAVERPPQRVADRRIDLAGDLRDRDPVGDRQIELDVERLAEVDGDPRMAEPEPAEQPVERTGGEAGHPVRPERRGPHDIEHGPAGDERSTGGRLGRHAGDVLLA